ncbi:hypothetical protein WDV93_18740 [Pantoea ananatis]
MSEPTRYTLPVKSGDQRQLGQLTGAAHAVGVPALPSVMLVRC